MMTKSRFGALLILSLLLVLVYYKLVPKLNDFNFRNAELIHRTTKYGKYCIEENICQNSTQDQSYMYVRTTLFDDHLASGVNTNQSCGHSHRIVPNIVHYAWFTGAQKGNSFRFHHMISILSAHKFLKPTRIYFWHDGIPTGPYWKEVKEKVSKVYLIFRNISNKINVPGLVGLEVILEYGGFYFDLDVVVLKPMDKFRRFDATIGYDADSELCNGIIIARPWAAFLKIWRNGYRSNDYAKWAGHSPTFPTKLAKQYKHLIHIDARSLNRPHRQEVNRLYQGGGLYNWRTHIYAIHLWNRHHKVEHNIVDIRYWNTAVGEVYRWVYYGDWRIQSHPAKEDCLVENICKAKPGSITYYYSRNSSFLKNIDSPFDITVNTSKASVPNIVHFTWYRSIREGNVFRFHHLISVLSVSKFIKPSVILFWHELTPDGGYWKDVLQRVPELKLIYRYPPLEIRGQKVNARGQIVSHLIKLEAMLEFGGIYLDLDVIVVKSLAPLLNFDLTMGHDITNGLNGGVIIGRAWGDFLKLWHRKYETFNCKRWKYHSVNLPSILAMKYPNLIHVEKTSLHRPNYKELDKLYGDRNLYQWRESTFTVHLWTRIHKIEHNREDIKFWNTTVGEIFRYVYYNDWKIRKTQAKLCLFDTICKSAQEDQIYTYYRDSDFLARVDRVQDEGANIKHHSRVIPSLVHYTWYGGKQKGNTFRFHHLISVLASVRFLKPDKILFWHDLEPEGPYWDEIQMRVPQLNKVFRPPPTEIRGRRVVVAEHLTDIVRLEAILEFGGVYLDLDAIVVKPMEPLLKYDVTMGYETDQGLCNGIIISKPWTEFLKLWHREYITFNDRIWAYHSVQLPAKLALRYPALIHTELKSMHRPNWQQTAWLYEEGKLYDWRASNYAVHLWIRFHKTEHNATDIRTWNTTAGEIFRYVYYSDWTINSENTTTSIKL